MEIKHIKIGGLTYQIIHVEEENFDKEAAGSCDSSKLEIRVLGNIPPTAYRHKLLHEVIHGMNFEMDEVTTEHWAVILEQVLVDNPQFTRLFLKKR